jgi:hypothetical protein
LCCRRGNSKEGVVGAGIDCLGVSNNNISIELGKEVSKSISATRDVPRGTWKTGYSRLLVFSVVFWLQDCNWPGSGLEGLVVPSNRLANNIIADPKEVAANL